MKTAASKARYDQIPDIRSYTKDPGDIQILETTTYPPDTILVTVDVTSLYLNIPQDEGTDCCINALNRNQTNPLPDHHLKHLFDFVLKHIFQFAGDMYQQIHDTAMGTKMAPSYANLFMQHLEESFLRPRPDQPALWKRHIDDILILWPHSRDKPNTLLQDLNQFYPTIKFTNESSDQSINFLDLTIYKGPRFKEKCLLDIKTYFKPTNSFQYLHYSTCHPRTTLKGIIKGETIRFLRSMSDQTTYQGNYPRRSTTTDLHPSSRDHQFPTKPPIINLWPLEMSGMPETPSIRKDQGIHTPYSKHSTVLTKNVLYAITCTLPRKSLHWPNNHGY